MTLNDILKTLDDNIDFDKICLIRHTDTELKEYLLDETVFNFYQSIQSKRLETYQYLISFAAIDNKTIFQGIYEIKGKEIFSEKHLLSFDHPLWQPTEQWCKEHLGQYNFYSLELTIMFNELIGRLVIDWGKAAIHWFQKYDNTKPKLITEILSQSYFKEFTGYHDVSLTRLELEKLFKTQNPIWKSKLEAVDGVYIIMDEDTGHQYIGSAYGKLGIWGRWDYYFTDATGGNEKFKELRSMNSSFYKKFRYSILEIFPKTFEKEQARAREALYKRKLGSKAFGLNLN